VAVIFREVGSHVSAEGGHVGVGNIGPHGRVAAPGREDSEHPLTPPLLLRGAVDAGGRGATLRHLNGDVQLGPEEVQGRPALRKEACAKVRRRLRVVPNAASAAPERLRAHATLDVVHDPCVDSGAARAPAMWHREHSAREEERQSVAGGLCATAPRATHQTMPGATPCQQKGSSQSVPETLQPRGLWRRSQRLRCTSGLVGVLGGIPQPPRGSFGH
jgi:hypothetical protein